jgi:mannose-6-phosphate isomerase-like protein (cupin superfamily)
MVIIMDEYQKGMDISLKGKRRKKAIERFNLQMKDWGIAIPPNKPIVLDFGLDDFYSFGLIECWIANEKNEGYCGKYLFVFDNQTCPAHKHNEKHETFYVIEGKIAVQCENRTFDLSKGEIFPINKGKEHSFRGIEPSLMLELSKPCIIEDNYFTDNRIPIGGNFNK